MPWQGARGGVVGWLGVVGLDDLAQPVTTYKWGEITPLTHPKFNIFALEK